jgi:LysR family transcriptional regulator, nod-box dependent transcriptional activator
MHFNQFDLNLLRALDALLSERNVTRAADTETLFVSQQAMSGSLHRLREHFHDPLLVRVGRQMELPPARALAGPVREALLREST